ncbi:Cilia- and flagella-associated protein 36 [Hondaea fermentalgiana]|uniref:Cilia- and flagella-associated protein 36 n=1 Tax=Hondaea fermentalgiana TaxID=2315210 RepID=A0A2R5GFG4_9STRA|nr:Cilia- and flagella-associated protein 36 [Hondaea fermentalgiana]|eukprot:GBG29305.1 Cilia- and flagella-associated protein 36 [Hondaea fermentalgiana]
MSDPEWVFEYMCQVLQSPSWEVPVMTFIDETCAIFDNEEENKLSHTQAHSDFKELVERLLTQHLTDVGISAEDFYEACEIAYKGEDATDVAQRIVSQLVACDDFLTFKAIMFKRNKELEMEALMELDAEDGDSQELAVVLRRSSAEAKEGDLLERQETAALEEAIQLSEETERLKDLSILEKEQADLEAAIALSLAVEEERLQMLANSSESKEAEGKQDDSHAEEKNSSESKSGAPMRYRSALPPIGAGKGADACDINEQRDLLEQQRLAAEKIIGRAPRVEINADAEFDEVDVARRKRHLEAQRKLLLAKKNAERAARLKEFEEQKRDEGGAAQKAIDAQNMASKGSETRKISAQQSHLTHALARRMKQDLIESSGTNGADGISGLEDKLKQVERLRQQRASLARTGF